MRYAPGNFRGLQRLNPVPRYGYPGQRAGFNGSRGRDRDHDGDHDPDHHRRSYVSIYSFGYPYASGWSIWPGYPTVLDDYGDFGDSYDQQSYAPSNDYGDQGDNGYGYYDGQDQGPQFGYPGQQPPRQWPSLGPSAPQYSEPQQSSASAESAVTLVFKDGRTQMIHNYVLTQRSIFIGDSRGVTVPMDQIDVAATEQANRDAGVDFHLPQSLN